MHSSPSMLNNPLQSVATDTKLAQVISMAMNVILSDQPWQCRRGKSVALLWQLKLPYRDSTTHDSKSGLPSQLLLKNRFNDTY